MSDNFEVLNRLKNMQSVIRENKQTIFPIQQAQHQVLEINNFVKNILEPTLCVLHQDDQTHIAMALDQINKLMNEINEKCRTPRHFELQSDYFLSLIKNIENLIYSINFHVEYGISHVFPEGISILQKIKQAGQEAQIIKDNLERKNLFTYFSLPVSITIAQKTTILGLCNSIQQLCSQLMKQTQWSKSNYTFSLNDLQNIQKYFKEVQTLTRIQEQYFSGVLKKQSAQEIVPTNVSDVFMTLGKLELKISNYESESSNSLLRHSSHLKKETLEELWIRFREYYIPLESVRFLRERSDILVDLSQARSKEPESVVEQFLRQVTREMKLLQFFVLTLSSMDNDLRKMALLLHNLSISFGKVYQLSTTSQLLPDFLNKALTVIHGLLRKSLNVFDSRKEHIQKLQQVICQAGLFQKNIENGLLNDLKILEQAGEDINHYDEKIIGTIKNLDNILSLSPTTSRKLLREAYEDQAELTSACIALGNVTSSFSLMTEAIKTIFIVYQKVLACYKSTSTPSLFIESVSQILKKHSTAPDPLLKKISNMASDLDWFIDNVLLDNSKKEKMFCEELHTQMSQIQDQISLRLNELQEKTKLAAAFESSQKQVAAAQTAVVQDAFASPSIVELTKKTTGASFEPFISDVMRRLKDACSKIGSERSLALLKVLEQPHVVVDYMERLESAFDPNSTESEQDYLEEVLSSQDARDLIMNFLQMKFMPYGYFDSHGQKYHFDDSNQSFDIPKNAEPFIRFTQRMLETPKNIYRRLIRVMLGYDGVDVMGHREHEKIIDVLRSDHILSKDEQARLKSFVPFIP
ncbi:MAG: hypothetical protein HQM12_11250 [SAR324 cluster bacterium]|nr:hypothetical protein [SAR324 cluster bacterium]